MTTFEPIHLGILANCGYQEQEPVGRKPKDWYARIQKYLDEPPQISGLAENQVKRQDILDMVQRGDDIYKCCVTILAWGAMRYWGAKRNHGAMLFKTHAHWIPVAEKIRAGKLSRSEAYDEFKKLREDKRKPLEGMGPAYFTKLIHFLMPAKSQRGYIMDQWTSLSMNMLISKPLVRLYPTRYKNGDKDYFEYSVTDENDSSIYEQYCSLVEELSAVREIETILDGKVSKTDAPSAVEIMLFSKGGRKRQGWRQYVVDQRCRSN